MTERWEVGVENNGLWEGGREMVGMEESEGKGTEVNG